MRIFILHLEKNIENPINPHNYSRPRPHYFQHVLFNVFRLSQIMLGVLLTGLLLKRLNIAGYFCSDRVNLKTLHRCLAYWEIHETVLIIRLDSSVSYPSACSVYLFCSLTGFGLHHEIPAIKNRACHPIDRPGRSVP